MHDTKKTSYQTNSSEIPLLESRDVNTLYKDGKEYTYFSLIQGSDSEAIVQFDEPFKNVISVEVVQAHIPFTEYSIENDRNYISFEYQLPGGNYQQATVTFPSQDYTKETLIQMFNSLISSGSTIVMAENPDTKIFYFQAQYPFRILETTTCLTPLGLGQLPLSTPLNSYLDTSDAPTFPQILTCPYRWNLIVSNVLYVNCPELDTYINRGKPSNHKITRPSQSNLVTRHVIQPLATFIHEGDGIQQQHYRQEIPSRKFKPISSLEQLTIHFTRDTNHSIKQVVPYDFKGLKWCLKISIKTLELDSIEQGFQPTTHQDIDVQQTSVNIFNQQSNNFVSSQPRRNVIPTQFLTRSMPRASNYYK